MDNMGSNSGVDPVGGIMGGNSGCGMENSSTSTSSPHDSRPSGLDNGRGSTDSLDSLDSRSSADSLDNRGGNGGGGSHGNRGVDGDGRGSLLTVVGHNSIETINSISGIGNPPNPTVGIGNGIRPSHAVTITGFLTGFGVSGFGIGYGIPELVRRIDINGFGFNHGSGSGNGSDSLDNRGSNGGGGSNGGSNGGYGVEGGGSDGGGRMGNVSNVSNVSCYGNGSERNGTEDNVLGGG